MIKVTTNDKRKDEATGFPKLMISKNNGEIILVRRGNETSISGTCIHDPDKKHTTGFYSEDWSTAAFSDYTGEVTLKNEFI